MCLNKDWRPQCEFPIACLALTVSGEGILPSVSMSLTLVLSHRPIYMLGLYEYVFLHELICLDIIASIYMT